MTNTTLLASVLEREAKWCGEASGGRKQVRKEVGFWGCRYSVFICKKNAIGLQNTVCFVACVRITDRCIDLSA